MDRMRIIIKETQLDKLQQTFNRLMTRFSKLHEIERPYDFWDSNKNSYVDYTPLNYYETIDDEEWEDDDWLLQYAKDEPYTHEVTENYPLLIYSDYYFKSRIKTFGPLFETLLKNWFEETYGHKVKKVVEHRYSDDILGIFN